MAIPLSYILAQSPLGASPEKSMLSPNIMMFTLWLGSSQKNMTSAQKLGWENNKNNDKGNNKGGS